MALQFRNTDRPLSSRVRLALALLLLVAAFQSQAFAAPKNLKKGWRGDVQLGALASFGETSTSTINALTSLSFSGTRWEHELEAKYYRSSSESLVALRDENDQLRLDSNGNEIFNTVRNLNHDRRYLSADSRWFFTSKFYLFSFADLDFNKPANLSSSSKAIYGAGYKFYENKKNYLSAGIGVGRKKREEATGIRTSGGIAYLTVGFKREMSEKLLLSIDWDSDFSAEDRYSEAQLTLSYKLRDPLSLKMKYELRFDSTPLEPLHTFDEGLEGVLSLNLAIDVF